MKPFIGIPREDIFFTTKLWMGHYGYNQTMNIIPKRTESTSRSSIDAFSQTYAYMLNNECIAGFRKTMQAGQA